MNIHNIFSSYTLCRTSTINTTPQYRNLINKLQLILNLVTQQLIETKFNSNIAICVLLPLYPPFSKHNII